MSTAQPSVAELGGGSRVLVRQRRDHAEPDHPLDRLRSTRGVEHEEVLTSLARSVSRTASRALADVAGAIEHLPVLEHGERPSTRPGRTEAEQ